MARTKLSFGEGSGQDALGNPTDLRSYYNAWALDTILWMAKPKGFNHGIEKIAGTANVPDVYDIEMLLNIFYSIIGMPKSWVGIGEPGANGPTSGRALLAQDMRFLRKVRALRKPVVQAYTWLAYLHALLRGYDISTIEIRAKMSYISTLEDELRMEVLGKQVDIMDKMGDMLDKYHLEKDAWIDLVMRKYMHMPDDVINSLRVSLPPELEPQQEAAITKEGRLHEGRKRALTARTKGRNALTESRLRMSRAFDEMKAWIEGRYGKNVVEDMHKQLNGERMPALPRHSLHELNRMQTLPPAKSSTDKFRLFEDGGKIISSFDQLSNATPTVNESAIPSSGNEPAYRRWGPRTH